MTITGLFRNGDPIFGRSKHSFLHFGFGFACRASHLNISTEPSSSSLGIELVEPLGLITLRWKA
ncbi:hypothetical protein LINPERHAP2_LOCUS6111 [Linum perenne]